MYKWKKTYETFFEGLRPKWRRPMKEGQKVGKSRVILLPCVKGIFRLQCYYSEPRCLAGQKKELSSVNSARMCRAECQKEGR